MRLFMKDFDISVAVHLSPANAVLLKLINHV
jgi:hypothetical protein